MAVGGGGTGVFVGGTGVFVGGTGVFVGGTGVLVGGTGVFVGGTGVFVGGTGVFVGGTGVFVGLDGGGDGGADECPSEKALPCWSVAAYMSEAECQMAAEYPSAAASAYSSPSGSASA